MWHVQVLGVDTAVQFDEGVAAGDMLEFRVQGSTILSFSRIVRSGKAVDAKGSGLTLPQLWNKVGLPSMPNDNSGAYVVAKKAYRAWARKEHTDKVKDGGFAALSPFWKELLKLLESRIVK